MKKLILFALCMIILVGSVSATDVAYVLKNPSNPNSDFINTINSLGLTYELIDDSQVSSTDFSDYIFILIGDDDFSDSIVSALATDISENKALVVNSHHYYKSGTKPYFGYSGDNLQVTSPTSLTLTATQSSITSGLPQGFNSYTNSDPDVKTSILRGQKPIGMRLLVYKTGNSAETVVAVVEPGVKYLNGKTAQEPSVFIGMTETHLWTSQSQKIFENSITYLIEGEDRDDDGFFTGEDCDDTNPNINPDADEIPYDGIDQNCDGNDLKDVDGDGYEAEIVGGLDCNDNNSTINPGSIDLKLNCVNDKPVLVNNISNLEWNEDSEITINLSEYFSDPEDDNLIYSVDSTSGGTGISLDLNSNTGIAIFTPNENWNGGDWIVFSASDGDKSVKSNTVLLLVESVNDNPVINFINNIVVFVGELIVINPSATDVDGDDLSYSFSDPLNENGEWQTISGDEGNYNVTVSVSDGKGGFDSQTVNIVVQDPVSPNVSLISPLNNELFDTRDIEFMFYVEDNSNPLTCELYFENELIDSMELELINGSSEDSFNVEGINDGVYLWNVLCKDLTNNVFANENMSFEVSAPDHPEISLIGNKQVDENKTLSFSVSANDKDGDDLEYFVENLPDGATFFNNVFSWSPTYSQSGTYNVVFKVRDSTGLEDTETVKITVINQPAPPSFEDATFCKESNHNISINIKNPDEDDDFEIGEIIDVEVDVENNFDEDLDFKVEAYLYDLTEEESLEDDDDKIEIDEGDEETFELELEIPEDIDNENDLAVYVYVEDEEDRCLSEYVLINVEREDDALVINRFEIFPAQADVKGIVEFDVRISNIGNDEQDVVIKLSNNELGLNIESEEFEIEEYGESDSESKRFSFIIPESTKSGDYEILLEVEFSGERISERKTLSVQSIETSDTTKLINSNGEIDLGGNGLSLISLGSSQGTNGDIDLSNIKSIGEITDRGNIDLRSESYSEVEEIESYKEDSQSEFWDDLKNSPWLWVLNVFLFIGVIVIFIRIIIYIRYLRA